MREIKFRGKVRFNGNYLSSGEWVYGSLIIKGTEMGKYIYLIEYDSIGNRIRGFDVEVISDTIGQFTGFIAKKCKLNIDKQIYEGDIFRGEIDSEGNDITQYYVVMWITQLGAFYLIPVEHYAVMRDNDVSKEEDFEWLFREADLNDFSIDVGLTKVGNIHDDIELLKKYITI